MEFTNAFLRAINFTLADHIEGGLSLDPEDRGNWTGGAKGKGELKGTKYGISAAAYPALDIPSLTRDQVTGLYWRDYWTPVRGDDLPPNLAGLVFDAAVNHGVGRASKMLQRALGVEDDGIIGPGTVAAARRQEPSHAIPLFLAERALAYTAAPTWKTHGKGWMRRLFYGSQEFAR